jgi:hypothetical protein
MLSRGEVAIIEAEIERLEKALSESTDSGIRDRIKAWIKEEKKKLIRHATPIFANLSGNGERPAENREVLDETLSASRIFCSSEDSRQWQMHPVWGVTFRGWGTS